MFTNTFAPLVGGIEKSVATFTEDLRELGHEILIVTLEQGAADTSEPGILRLPALPDVVAGQYAWKLPGTVGLSAALDEFAPDLLHAHQPFMLGNSAYRHAVRRGLPLVFTNHTLYERYADRTFLGEFEALERAARAVAVVFANRCEAVIAPTQSIAEILRSQGVETKLEIVPTGIDTGRFACGKGPRFRERYGIPGNAFVVGHLGRLIPAKRVAYLAEATVAFLSGSPESRALFCGEGEMVGEIRSRFEAADISDRLVLVGNLSDDEKIDAYSAMNLFTFASLTDTQGIVLLEAMAAGVAVLALSATGPGTSSSTDRADASSIPRQRRTASPGLSPTSAFLPTAPPSPARPASMPPRSIAAAVRKDSRKSTRRRYVAIAKRKIEKGNPTPSSRTCNAASRPSGDSSPAAPRS